ncbi:BREX-1 system phosphatase PglZ type A [Carboxydothermus hydrogenoformans]|uniref:Uncharacterized protein n=1 Tax=Carboxydothermus hydrogenoformans (strain ATCC BAA-161 / DSM 6008 / Z-2901) TaxID=246194 RepID=Q3A8U0_CARHZ|nr:BREX-1 system phosphatase PglZ type A [Carboxydothermus hydrogenoformans]ABB14281.1 conserved hypothetical protein [Carboxydothermus hydrogenoformans Z-2901]
MELNEVKKKLEEILNKELTDGRKRNIVFWYDDNGEFKEDIDALNLSNAKILKLNGRNSFYVKYILERVDKESNYLIYAPYSKPKARENYLLDIQKYSFEFSTDRATIIMMDLNVTDYSLHDAFKKYLKFFNNKERYRAFKEYALSSYTEEILDIAVLSVLCKLPYPDLEEVLKTLLAEYAYGESTLYENIIKFGDINAFWELVRKYYGYNLEQKDLEKLSIFLLITGLAFSLKRDLPKQWEPFVSPKQTNVVVFLSHFMGGNSTKKAFRLLSQMVEEKIRLKEYITKWDVDSYKDSDIFRLFDEGIIQNILDNLLSDVGEFDRYKEIIMDRRSKHWFEDYENEYNALYWACVLLEEWKNQKDTIKEYPPHDFFKKYTEEYYKVDMAYRKFIYFFDRLDNKEWFAALKEKIENTYINGFINILSIKWSNSIETLQEYWSISSVPCQWEFFREKIKPHLNKGERVFVIISDALRFEAGRELAEMLNTERRGTTEISAMQGVLPSYTKLGMAALLPHKKIEIDSDYEVFVDGISVEGTDNRNMILQNHVNKSIAVQYKDIIDLRRDDLRKLLGGKELIYIYHNSIDARGDHYLTEREVFDAVAEAFEQLKSLVNNLVNHLSATHIYIISDHGFVYKRGSVEKSEKTSMDKIEDAYENRRFILTDKPMEIEGTLSFDMKYLLGEATQLKCITPRSTNRFELKGAGANYVHGGSSLQEIVIPVIYFKNERGKSAKDVQKVRVTLLSLTRKITNTITYLEFFQTEKVGDKMVPCRLKVYFADEDGNRVSNENIIIADSKSENPEERKFREKFVLKNMKYDKTKKYYLILEDEEETVENIYDRIPFTIDLAITNEDFGF